MSLCQGCVGGEDGEGRGGEEGGKEDLKVWEEEEERLS